MECNDASSKLLGDIATEVAVKSQSLLLRRVDEIASSSDQIDPKEIKEIIDGCHRSVLSMIYARQLCDSTDTRGISIKIASDEEEL